MRVLLAMSVEMIVALIVAASVSSQALAEPVRTQAAGLRFKHPSEWTRVPAPSDMRAAQFRVPKAEGDAEDAEVVLFFFGKGKGGGAQENVERWQNQMTQPDGKPSKDVAVVTIKTVNGLKVTSLDVPGTYKGMGAGGAPTAAKPGYRMLAAAIEGAAGPWFLRLVGPDATVRGARAGFEEVVGSVEAHQ